MNNTKPEQHRKGKKLVGTVSSIAQTKTVTVVVSSVWVHPLYRKSMRRTKKIAAHNPSLTLSTGDRVAIVETKPISKRKHFIVVEKIS